MAQDLNGKKILLGISGGIAAYKSAELCRELIRSGADVRVVMTSGAQEFISPLTMQALSGNTVHTSLLDPDAESGMGHIELAKWPDLIVIAPASANFIARYSNGFAGDLLSTLLLATTVPVALAPAMNQAMWKHPITQRNLSELVLALDRKITIFGPGSGEQACGDIGPGRMLEANDIKLRVMSLICPKAKILKNKIVVITAGPTREAIDPVRYVSNHSSGKMGYALAAACQQLGAEVILISGPTNLDTPIGVTRKNIISAQEMYDAVLTELDNRCDVFIACAAVADYRPVQSSSQKIKKSSNEQEGMTLQLQQNPDIVAAVASRKNKPFTVGFAAETHEVLRYAEEKLKKKGLDMIVANDVSKPGLGFNSDQNEVHVVSPSKTIKLACQSKMAIAEKIVDQIALAM